MGDENLTIADLAHESTPEPSAEPTTPAPSEPEAQTSPEPTEQQPTTQPKETEGPSAEPLIARLQASGVRPQDIEQIRRYYEYKAEVERLKADAPETRARAVISQISDPEIRRQHEQYLTVNGPFAYLLALQRDQQPEPDMTEREQEPEQEPEPEKPAEEMPAWAKAMMERDKKREAELEELRHEREESQAASRRKALSDEITGQITAAKIPDYAKSAAARFARSQVFELASDPAYAKTPTINVVKQALDEFSKLLTAHTEATTQSLRKQTVPAKPGQPKPVERQNIGALDEAKTIDELIKACGTPSNTEPAA